MGRSSRAPAITLPRILLEDPSCPECGKPPFTALAVIRFSEFLNPVKDQATLVAVVFERVGPIVLDLNESELDEDPGDDSIYLTCRNRHQWQSQWSQLA